MITANLQECGEGLAYNREGNIKNVLNFLPDGKVLMVTFFFFFSQRLYHNDYPKKHCGKSSGSCIRQNWIL